MRAPILAVALALLAVPLTGCIGGDEEPIEPQADTSGTQVDQLPGNPSVLHPIAGSNATPAISRDQALGGLPVPRGVGFVVDAPLFEPTIGVTSDGALFVSNTGKGELSEEDPPPDTEYSSILRSTDQGQTWEDVTGSIGPVSIPPETSDPYVYVDEATDRVYNLDMIGLNCNWVRWSDDLGESWINNPAGCGQPPVLDHPTLFAGPPNAAPTVGYENVLYLCVNRVADSACSTSLDGGLTWTPFLPVYGPSAGQTGGFCGGLHAHGVTAPDGTAYLPRGYCGVPMIAVSQDDGLTWERHVISEDVPTLGHEVAIAVDDQGTAFAFWISEDHHPQLAYSTDKGVSWSQPVDVAPPGVSVTSHPTIEAGTNGAIALAYVGTETDAESYGDMPDEATWNAYLAIVTDATDPDASVATTTANDPDHPIGLGVCGGTRCRAADDGGIGDFIDVTIDDDGRPWAVFVDVCLETCEQTGEPDRAKGVGLVGTLAQGPSLHDPTAPLPALPALPGEAAPANGTSAA